MRPNRIPRIHPLGIGAASVDDMRRIANDNFRRELEGPFYRTRPLRRTLTEFADVYRQYRKAHSPLYAMQTAWRIAVQGAPF